MVQLVKTYLRGTHSQSKQKQYKPKPAPKVHVPRAKTFKNPGPK